MEENQRQRTDSIAGRSSPLHRTARQDRPHRHVQDHLRGAHVAELGRRIREGRRPSSARLLETSCTIMDLKGVGLTNISSVYGYVQKASGISQNYYPERMGKLYIINAPWGFSSVFSMVKKFLDPVTVAKIHVLGGGYTKELLAQIPKENLPKQFGGSCSCPHGCELSDAGPWQDAQWVKPAAWEKKAGDNVIENTDATISHGLPGDAPAGVTAGTAPQGHTHGVPAPQ